MGVLFIPGHEDERGSGKYGHRAPENNEERQRDASTPPTPISSGCLGHGTLERLGTTTPRKREKVVLVVSLGVQE